MSTYKGKRYSINKEEFMLLSGVIFYKGIPIWETISANLKDYDFYLLDETMYPYGFLTLTCKDEHDDLFHYGRWENLEQANEWLDRPVVYRRCE